ncbi:kinase-like protein [Lentithecium fluviatile CBS 122367]|uniref:Kinase-like protein n=1 Tax=Lentithecium fluviatile CBS 122367 TaxID=1168545 RepID=A0A6G1J099_9PLEO|nr:kinase-like protein [Lentithecium fluviatile CBS 122367]
MATYIFAKTQSLMPSSRSNQYGINNDANLPRKHPTIGRCKEIVFECYDMGKLAHYINKNSVIPENFIWSAFAQMTSSLHHLHTAGIVHGDFKAENVTSVSCQNPPEHIPHRHHGTWQYSSPESSRRYGPEADVRAIGVVKHLICHKRWPHCQVQKIKISHDLWFARQGLGVPPATQYHNQYRSFCVYYAERVFAPRRLDTASFHRYGKTRSKVLNYVMMRCLDANWATHITAMELERFVPVLQVFVQACWVSRSKGLLGHFDDRVDASGNASANFNVTLQIYCALADEARQIPGNREKQILDMGAPLLMVMDMEDCAEARRHLEETCESKYKRAQIDQRQTQRLSSHQSQ